MEYRLAIDIGASSGRHIVGRMEDGHLITEEVYRFPNRMEMTDGHLVWDMERLFSEVKRGIAEAIKRFGAPLSLAVDTWGVDYVLMRGESPVFPVYAYRDSRNIQAAEQVHAIVSFEKLYERTGIQFVAFNSVYQLYADKLAGRLCGVTDFLMLPEFVNYMLTGVKKKEYTIATTTGLVNVRDKAFDKSITDALGLPQQLFSALHEGGEDVGTLLPEVAAEVGGDTIVKLCLSHDTASAVHSVGGNSPYISSGTWSIVGVKQPLAHTDGISLKNNFSNEGGYKKAFRYQKNVMGMWAINSVAAELETTVQRLAESAKLSGYDGVVDINHADFMAPDSMLQTVKRHLRNNGFAAPNSTADISSCIFRSMALSYRDTLAQLEAGTGQSYGDIVVVGGGAKNVYLNSLTEEYTGKRVIARPVEGTALGNLMVQFGAEPTL